MKAAKLTIVCLSMMSLTAVRASAQGWNNIVPLHTTRAEVEQRFGKPTDPGKQSSAVYDLNNEVVLIFFSSGVPCSSSNRWNVSEGTVVDITVTPKKQLVFIEMNIDLEKYIKTVDPHYPHHTKYINKETGQSIIVSNGEVQYFTYSPADRDNHLRCPSSSLNVPTHGPTQYAYTMDFYGNIPFEDEMLRLDNFAIQLKSDPLDKGYIKYYWDDRPRTARTRAIRAQRYIIKRFRIDPSRIMLIEGDHRNKFMIELGILTGK